MRHFNVKLKAGEPGYHTNIDFDDVPFRGVQRLSFSDIAPDTIQTMTVTVLSDVDLSFLPEQVTVTKNVPPEVHDLLDSLALMPTEAGPLGMCADFQRLKELLK